MLSPGSVVQERFEILAHVAEGGMGVVYRALDRHSGDPVALKLLGGVLIDPQAGSSCAPSISSRRSKGVIDYGEGIEPQFLDQIFERFHQIDMSPTRSESGLGLGLAIARELVELHSGTVEAQSEGKGKGSTFVVTLPVRSPAACSGS